MGWREGYEWVFPLGAKYGLSTHSRGVPLDQWVPSGIRQGKLVGSVWETSSLWEAHGLRVGSVGESGKVFQWKMRN